MTYLQALILGLIQGITELFPVSSLGHSVLLPALFGWTNVVKSQIAPESFFLAFLVGLHCATALALLFFYRSTWLRLLRAFVTSIRTRQIKSRDERLIWLLIIATIPAGLVGVLFERVLRILFATPALAAVFLTINGVILFVGDRMRRRGLVGRLTQPARSLESMKFSEAGIIGVAQILALLAGISRSGITMVAGLARGLDHEEAATFSFLLATPIILAAGVYKVHDFLGPNGDGVRGQIIAGSLAAGIAAYLSVRFLARYFKNSSLRPFAWYSLIAGIVFTVRFTLF